jgi:hypothetical protein
LLREALGGLEHEVSSGYEHRAGRSRECRSLVEPADERGARLPVADLRLEGAELVVGDIRGIRDNEVVGRAR